LLGGQVTSRGVAIDAQVTTVERVLGIMRGTSGTRDRASMRRLLGVAPFRDPRKVSTDLQWRGR